MIVFGNFLQKAVMEVQALSPEIIQDVFTKDGVKPVAADDIDKTFKSDSIGTCH